jgi:hypothetical protein
MHYPVVYMSENNHLNNIAWDKVSAVKKESNPIWTCEICQDPLDMQFASGPDKSYAWFKHYDIDRMRDGYYGRKIHVCMKPDCVPKCSICKQGLTRYIRFKANREWSCERCASHETNVEFDPNDGSIDSDCEYAIKIICM